MGKDDERKPDDQPFDGLDTSRFLDEDGELTDLQEMGRQGDLLLGAGSVEVVRSLAADRLAVTEDPDERLLCTMWLTRAAASERDPKMVLFHLDKMVEDLDEDSPAYLRSMHAAFTAHPYLDLGDLDSALRAVRRSRELLEEAVSDEESVQGLTDYEAAHVRNVVGKHAVSAQRAVLWYLTGNEMWEVLRAEAEGGLVKPVSSAEEAAFHQALADCEAADENAGGALGHLMAAERAAVEAGELPVACRVTCAQAALQLKYFEGSAARETFVRATEYLDAYLGTPDCEEDILRELTYKWTVLRDEMLMRWILSKLGPKPDEERTTD